MNHRRSRCIYMALGLGMLLELVVLFLRSGVVKGLSNRSDRLKIYAHAMIDDLSILPGDIIDRNGDPIVTYGEREVVSVSKDGEEETSIERFTEYQHARAFSQLIGYTGNRAIDLNAESIDQIVGERAGYRLLSFLDQFYWGNNGLYETANVDGTKGQSAVLTIDSGLQEEVYRALCEEMQDGESIGSAVVLDAKTGEILAMVALPTYDFGDIRTAVQQMKADTDQKRLESEYPVTYKNPEVPGSIFKAVTAIALIDHGMEDFTVENVDYTVNGWTCHAAKSTHGDVKVEYGDELDLDTALAVSSNVYFTKAALALGKDRMKETAGKFMLGMDSADLSGQEEESGTGIADYQKGIGTLHLDCGDVPYNWNLDEKQENVPMTDDVLAQTGMGQGTTEITTLQAAMIYQGIANDGKMMRPYIVQRLVDAQGKTVYEGEQEELKEVTGSETAERVADCLRKAAQANAQSHNMPEVQEAFDNYRVAGKTGTGEVPLKETEDSEEIILLNNAWFASFAPADDPRFVVVVNQCRTDKFGYRMMPVAADIYQYLFEEYQ